jgi:hypothetical protein
VAAVAADPHPLRAAWAQRDVAPLREALAADVVLHSPLLTKRFVGPAAALELYEVLFECFDEFTFVEEFAGDTTETCFWRGTLSTGEISGVDLIRRDPQGQIAEVWVYIRPLTALAAFAAAVGPVLARRRSRLRGFLAAALSLPLRPLFAVVDWAAGHIALSDGS